MRRLKHSAVDDPRWHELAAKYQDDWSLAAKEILGLALTPQQKQVMDALQSKGRRPSVTTPYGVGHMTLQCAIAILRVILYPEARVIIISNCIQSIRKRYEQDAFPFWRAALIHSPWLDLYFDMRVSGLRERADESWAMRFVG